MQVVNSPTTLLRANAKSVVALAALIMVVGIASALGVRAVLAHEGREVSGYYLDVGFISEPAYEGMLNGVVLTITRSVDSEGADEDAMQMEGEGDAPAMTDDNVAVDSDDPASADALALEFVADVEAHGEHFHSPSLARGAAFHFEITEDLRDLSLPYHIHPGDFEGTIEVGSDDGDGSEIAIDVTTDGLSDETVMVGVGDTVVWSNNTNFAASVMSGPASSMTDDVRERLSAVGTGAIDDPVPGQAQALSVDVTHLATGGQITLAFRESETQPGRYEAPFVPTALGEYEFRISGDIEGTTIDETFTAGPDTFDTVVSADAIQFPNSFRSSREIENAVYSAQDDAQEATDEARRGSNSANIALGLAIVGGLAGIAGLALGGFAFMSTRSRARSS